MEPREATPGRWESRDGAQTLMYWVGRRRQDDNLIAAAKAVNAAVATVMEKGPHTPDLGGSDTTDAVTAAIIT